ncbi:MAG: SpoIIE family protein phosphatase [Flavobacteriales bacterium]|nr:SpoIIE family protein phosphatase [Flavobacteriales bacterium]MCB9364740.1 SpoIIE family protein phosphatase [Flavobacteriales bacterium]
MHRNKYIQLIFYFLIIGIQTIIGQTYNFSNYNVAEGLEQSDVLTVNQAQNGYLLYGTHGGGLGVYDGYSFKSIKEKNGLSNNVVFSIDLSIEGDVWVATRNGVSLLNKQVTKVVKSYSKEVSFYWVHVNKTKDDVWFGSSQGLYKYNLAIDSVAFYKTENEILNTSFINCIYADSAGNLWIGTKKNGVFVIDKSKKVTNYTVKNGLTNNYVKTIIEGGKGTVFVGTLDGLNIIVNGVVSKIDLPKGEGTNLTFTSSYFYEDKIVFGALNSQLYFLDKHTLHASWIAPENGFPFKKTWSVFTDNEGILWLGTLGNGLVKFNPIFTFHDSQNGLLNDYINAVYENKQGQIFVGNNGGLNVIDKNQITTYKVDKLGFSNVFHINEDKNILYIGSNIGLYKFIDGASIRVPFYDKEIKDDNIFCSYRYKNKFYIGGRMGMYMLQDDKLYTVPNSPKEFVYSIIQFKGAIYMASNKGIYKYQNNQFKFLSKEEGLVCDRVKSFVVDSKNNLWIGTSEGAYLYNGKEFKKITEEDGLTSENIYLMELDGKGNIWLGSNKGLDRVNLESAYQHWNDIENKVEIRNYGKNEGFNGVECNLNTVFRNKQNQLLFGTINGLYTYHLENDKVNEVPPILTLNNIKLNFENVKWNDFTDSLNIGTNIPSYLDLTYNNNNLIFEYVGVSLTNPEEVQYQYMLEGLDENWLPMTKDRKAVYTAIPHGDYTFKLKAENSDGVWIEDEVVFTFQISPPWWKTNWFYASSIITILLLGYIIIVVRTRNLKKTQIILTNKVEERTKELREEKEKVESVNSELAHQKKEVEVANKNITDSINYAKKIQEAILPKAAKLEELKESVSVLYMPKDVVSGDFYWYERVGNKLVFAAADCTGHGVPGAFMSMIGVNNLNQIIIENKITSPDRILQELNIAIKKVLKQEDVDSESRDGMDISICCFDLEKNMVEYAGAFRPLIYIRDNELHELKGSRQPIGGSAPLDFNYDLNKFEIKKDDVFYMFSDGYPDQFGGPKGKKYMNKRLKEVFMKIYSEAPGIQRETLREELISWMGDNEQIDDILVMCIKI